MDYSPVFLKLRAIAFLCITLIGIIWTVALCLLVYFRWDISDTPSRSLVLVILSANVITVVMLPTLMILHFRPWLDGARLLFLLVAHIGSAVMFAIWSRRFQCSPVDDEAVCRAINLVVLVCTWIVPAFLLLYASGLALMLYRRRSRIEWIDPVWQDDGVVDMRPASGLSFRLPDIYVQTPMSLKFPVLPQHNSEQNDAWRRSSVGQGSSTDVRQSARLSTW